MRTASSSLLAIRAALAGLLALSSTVAAAQNYTVVETIITVEYFDDGTEEPTPGLAPAIGEYGPFRVISETRAQMNGVIDTDTPGLFAAMLRDHPGMLLLEMIDCPGSDDEDANLRLARMLREAGISTHVPAGGSVRSGAVELWLAGVHRSADEDAEFAVHSWRDETGLEANEAAAENPVHREYLNYYAAIGIPADRAKAFYDLTKSISYDDALYLAPSDMAALGLIDAG